MRQVRFHAPSRTGLSKQTAMSIVGSRWQTKPCMVAATTPVPYKVGKPP
jgi:hypothetical protein